MHLPKHRSSGFLLLEPLLAVTLFAAFIVFFLASFRNIYRTQDVSWRRVNAGIYAQEAMEVLYNISVNDETWKEQVDTFSATQPYSVSIYPDVEILEGAEILDEQYKREIYFVPGYRDDSGKLVSADTPDAQVDPNTYQIISRVSWPEGDRQQVVEYVHYFAK